MKLDPTNLSPLESYKLLAGSIVPRPIAFVSTVSDSGITNVAPFAWFTAVCTYPPMVCFTPQSRENETGKTHTLLNIEATRDFVINVVDYDLGPAMAVAAGNWPREISEFTAAGLTPIASERVKSPRVGESPISMECKLAQIIEFGNRRSWLVIGEVVQFHVRDELYNQGRIDLVKLKPLGRMAGLLYCYTHDMFELSAPSWDQVHAEWARSVGYRK